MTPPTRSSSTSIRTPAACMLSWSNFTAAGPQIEHVLRDNISRDAADLVGARGRLRRRVRRPGLDARASPRARRTPTSCGPASPHLLERQHHRLLPLDRQRRHLERADRPRRPVLHHGPGAGQRSRPHLPVDRRRQLARPPPRQHLRRATPTTTTRTAPTSSSSAHRRRLDLQPPVVLNSRPGQDRAQWFPWVTVDDTTGRVYVFYYDQGIATCGDLTETTYTCSDDGGAHWSRAGAADRPAVPGRLGQRHRPTEPRRLQPGRGAERRALLRLRRRLPAAVGLRRRPADLGQPHHARRRLPPRSRSSPHASRSHRHDPGPRRQPSPPPTAGGNGNIDPGETSSPTIPMTTTSPTR